MFIFLPNAVGRIFNLPVLGKWVLRNLIFVFFIKQEEEEEDVSHQIKVKVKVKIKMNAKANILINNKSASTVLYGN